MLNADRIKGMLYGVAIADSLGAPHEHMPVQMNKYTGLIHLPIEIHTRYHGLRVEDVGSTTDDTAMTLSLAGSIVSMEGYNENNVILSYLEFARTNKSMGKNTRNLFKGLKTIRGYRNRHKRMMDKVISEGNGFLMRCSPIAALDNWMEVAESDCWLTNPTEVCIDASRVYIKSIRDVDKTPEEVLARAIEMAETKEVSDVLEAVRNSQIRDVTGKTKGWWRHALYCTYYALMMNKSYSESIDWVIMQGGDTDTNGAIFSALIGTRMGFNKMNEESVTAENIKRVLVDHDELDNLASELAKLSKSQ